MTRTPTAAAHEDDEDDALEASGNHGGPEPARARENKVHKTCSDGTKGGATGLDNDIV
jgi:hypothetical protein